MSHGCGTCKRTFGHRGKAKCARLDCPGRPKNTRSREDNDFIAMITTGVHEIDPHHFYMGLTTADDSEGGAID